MQKILNRAWHCRTLFAHLAVEGKHTTSLQYRLSKRCTNKQSEQVAILKSLEYIQNINGWKEGNNIHRQPDDPGLHQKHQNPHISHRQNSTTNMEVGTS